MLTGYSIFNGEKLFADDGSQNHLIFQPKNLQMFTSSDKKVLWKSKDFQTIALKASLYISSSFSQKLIMILLKNL